MKKYTTVLLVSVLALSILLTGCSKYVCYDGTVKKNIKDCPILKVSQVADTDAGKYVDNYGFAVAQAKHQGYTRVNMYNQNASWYANVLFTDSASGDINKVLLKIDGLTGDVSCVTGCSYFNPIVPVVTSTPSESSPGAEVTQ